MGDDVVELPRAWSIYLALRDDPPNKFLRE